MKAGIVQFIFFPLKILYCFQRRAFTIKHCLHCPCLEERSNQPDLKTSSKKCVFGLYFKASDVVLSNVLSGSVG